MGQTIPKSYYGDMTHISGDGIVLLHYSPDWLTVYYRQRVSTQAWQAIPDSILVAAAGMSWRLAMTKESSSARVACTDGVWIKCLDPSTDWSEAAQLAGTPPQYPCEVQIQGTAWAQGVNVFELLASIEAALGLGGAERICGRLDLASDLEVSEAQYDHLVCYGSLPAVRENWVTRARKSRLQFQRGPAKRVETKPGEPVSAAIVGQYYTTLYLGARGGLQLVLYRKDAEFEGNTGALLRDEWKLRGWTGKPVVRVEARFSREWIREHWIGDTKGADASPEMCLAKGGALWRLATDHYRLAPQTIGGASRRRMRPTSVVWTIVQHSWDDWAGCDDFVSVEQVPDLSKLVESAGKRIEDLRLALTESQFSEVIKDIVAGLPNLDDYRQTKSRWRKYAHGREKDAISDNRQRNKAG